MSINYNKPLSDADYSARRFQVISAVECIGGVPNKEPYLDTKGYPTIGIGFKIDSNLDAILEGMGFVPGTPTEDGYISDITRIIKRYGSRPMTSSQMNRYVTDLDAVMARRAATYGITRTDFEYLSSNEVTRT